MNVLGNLRRRKEVEVDGVQSHAVVEVVNLAQNEREGEHTLIHHEVKHLLHLLIHAQALLEHGVQGRGLCLEDISALLVVTALSVMDGQAAETVKDINGSVVK